MAKEMSLAEYLGIPDPRKPEEPPFPSPGKLTPKAFCQAILNSSEFRTYIMTGLVLRDLPPVILQRLMDQGWGKPTERIEVKDTTTPLEEKSAEELEARAVQLAEMARRIRAAQGESDLDEEPRPVEPVH